MNYLTEIALRGIVVFDDWLKAPIGALVQMGVSAGAGAFNIIGMRIEFPAPNRTVDALLGVSDEHAGELIDDSQLQGPALDVSKTVEIVGIDPVPFTLSTLPQSISKGVLIKTRGLQPAYYVRSELTQIVKYICVVDGGNGSHPRGKCLTNYNPPDYVGVAKKIGVRLIAVPGHRDLSY
jgi:hypothetical protein